MRPNTCGSEEGTGSPGTEVTKSCELPYTCWEGAQVLCKSPQGRIFNRILCCFQESLEMCSKNCSKTYQKSLLNASLTNMVIANF